MASSVRSSLRNGLRRGTTMSMTPRLSALIEEEEVEQATPVPDLAVEANREPPSESEDQSASASSPSATSPRGSAEGRSRKAAAGSLSPRSRPVRPKREALAPEAKRKEVPAAAARTSVWKAPTARSSVWKAPAARSSVWKAPAARTSAWKAPVARTSVWKATSPRRRLKDSEQQLDDPDSEPYVQPTSRSRTSTDQATSRAMKRNYQMSHRDVIAIRSIYAKARQLRTRKRAETEQDLAVDSLRRFQEVSVEVMQAAGKVRLEKTVLEAFTVNSPKRIKILSQLEAALQQQLQTWQGLPDTAEYGDGIDSHGSFEECLRSALQQLDQEESPGEMGYGTLYKDLVDALGPVEAIDNMWWMGIQRRRQVDEITQDLRLAAKPEDLERPEQVLREARIFELQLKNTIAELQKVVRKAGMGSGPICPESHLMTLANSMHSVDCARCGTNFPETTEPRQLWRCVLCTHQDVVFCKECSSTMITEGTVPSLACLRPSEGWDDSLHKASVQLDAARVVVQLNKRKSFKPPRKTFIGEQRATKIGGGLGSRPWEAKGSPRRTRLAAQTHIFTMSTFKEEDEEEEEEDEDDDKSEDSEGEDGDLKGVMGGKERRTVVLTGFPRTLDPDRIEQFCIQPGLQLVKISLDAEGNPVAKAVYKKETQAWASWFKLHGRQLEGNLVEARLAGMCLLRRRASLGCFSKASPEQMVSKGKGTRRLRRRDPGKALTLEDLDEADVAELLDRVTESAYLRNVVERRKRKFTNLEHLLPKKLKDRHKKDSPRKTRLLLQGSTINVGDRSPSIAVYKSESSQEASDHQSDEESEDEVKELVIPDIRVLRRGTLKRGLAACRLTVFQIDAGGEEGLTSGDKHVSFLGQSLELQGFGPASPCKARTRNNTEGSEDGDSESGEAPSCLSPVGESPRLAPRGSLVPRGSVVPRSSLVPWGLLSEDFADTAGLFGQSLTLEAAGDSCSSSPSPRSRLETAVVTRSSRIIVEGLHPEAAPVAAEARPWPPPSWCNAGCRRSRSRGEPEPEVLAAAEAQAHSPSPPTARSPTARSPTARGASPRLAAAGSPDAPGNRGGSPRSTSRDRNSPPLEAPDGSRGGRPPAPSLGGVPLRVRRPLGKQVEDVVLERHSPTPEQEPQGARQCADARQRATRNAEANEIGCRLTASQHTGATPPAAAVAPAPAAAPPEAAHAEAAAAPEAARAVSPPSALHTPFSNTETADTMARLRSARSALASRGGTPGAGAAAGGEAAEGVGYLLLPARPLHGATDIDVQVWKAAVSSWRAAAARADSLAPVPPPARATTSTPYRGRRISRGGNSLAATSPALLTGSTQGGEEDLAQLESTAPPGLCLQELPFGSSTATDLRKVSVDSVLVEEDSCHSSLFEGAEAGDCTPRAEGKEDEEEPLPEPVGPRTPRSGPRSRQPSHGSAATTRHQRPHVAQASIPRQSFQWARAAEVKAVEAAREEEQEELQARRSVRGSVRRSTRLTLRESLLRPSLRSSAQSSKGSSLLESSSVLDERMYSKGSSLLRVSTVLDERMHSKGSSLPRTSTVIEESMQAHDQAHTEAHADTLLVEETQEEDFLQELQRRPPRPAPQARPRRRKVQSIDTWLHGVERYTKLPSFDPAFSDKPYKPAVFEFLSGKSWDEDKAEFEVSRSPEEDRD